MADTYQNKISIIITATDEASDILQAVRDQIAAVQEEISSSSDETSAAVDSSTADITSSLEDVGTAFESTAETAQSAASAIADSATETSTALATMADQTDAAFGQVGETLDAETAQFDAFAADMAAWGQEIATIMIGVDGSFASLGATADDYDANMATILQATQGAEGGITVLGDTVRDVNDNIIASNADVILSYQDVARAATGSAETTAASSGLSDAAGAGLGAAGISGASGLLGVLTSPEAIAAVAAGVTVRMSSDFQSQVTRLYTTAGEQAAQSTIEAGIQRIADLTGESVTSLTSGTPNQPGAAYVTSSAGYNQASGLQIVQAAAEAAKAEGADPGSVANALTTAMIDYNASPSQATSFMNQILTSVSEGKTTLQAESTALPTVLTTGATAGLTLSQVLGSLGTLTAAGVSTDQSGQDLSAMTKELAGHFTSTEVSALTNYGLNPTGVAQNFSKQGLTGTVDEIMQAMMQSKTPAGLIMQSTLQNSSVADADLKQMINAAPDATIKKLAQELESGQLSYTQFRTDSQALPEADTNYAKQIETEYNKANSFNSLLTGGLPGSQTVLTALGQVFGQSDTAQAAEILYQHKDKATENVAGVAASGAEGGANIAEWPKVAGNFNTQMSQMWQEIQTIGRGVGSTLLPALTDVAKFIGDDVLKPIADWITSGESLTKYLEDSTPMKHFAANIQNWAGDVGTAFSDALRGTETFFQAWGQIFSGLWGDIKKDTDQFATNIEQWADDAVNDVVKAFTQLPGKVGNALTSGGDSFVKDIGHDLHIPGFAVGTNSAPGGLAVVGENGPELVNLSPGSQVLTADETRSALGAEGSGPKVVIQQLNVNNNVDPGLVLRQIGWQLANAS